MLCLKLEAPFGVFRTFAAGSFRPTAGFITPSAAYGLLLNLAGIEVRCDDGSQPMTLIKRGLPRFQLAIGALVFPHQQSIYQQLHNYPVGSTTGKEHAPNTMGNKYNITPVRRAFLSDIQALICIRGNSQLEDQVTQGLRGELPRAYGLPFLGDNNFLISRLEPIQEPDPAHWFECITEDEGNGLRKHVTRMTITIDRADMAQTQSALFAPIDEPCAEIPEKAWVEVGY